MERQRGAAEILAGGVEDDTVGPGRERIRHVEIGVEPAEQAAIAAQRHVVRVDERHRPLAAEACGKDDVRRVEAHPLAGGRGEARQDALPDEARRDVDRRAARHDRRRDVG